MIKNTEVYKHKNEISFFVMVLVSGSVVGHQLLFL